MAATDFQESVNFAMTESPCFARGWITNPASGQLTTLLGGYTNSPLTGFVIEKPQLQDAPGTLSGKTKSPEVLQTCATPGSCLPFSSKCAVSPMTKTPSRSGTLQSGCTITRPALSAATLSHPDTGDGFTPAVQITVRLAMRWTDYGGNDPDNIQVERLGAPL